MLFKFAENIIYSMFKQIKVLFYINYSSQLEETNRLKIW